MARNKKQKIREITVVNLSDMIQINDDFAEKTGAWRRPQTSSPQEYAAFAKKVITVLQDCKASGVTQVKEEKETDIGDIETVYDIDTYIAKIANNT